MKTATVELPDDLARRAEDAAAARGKTLPELLVEALADKLGDTDTSHGSPRPYAWKELAGAFAKTPEDREETRRIQQVIDEEFGQIEPDDWK